MMGACVISNNADHICPSSSDIAVTDVSLVPLAASNNAHNESHQTQPIGFAETMIS